MSTKTLSVNSETTALALAALSLPTPSHVLLNCLSNILVSCFKTWSFLSLLSALSADDDDDMGSVDMTLMTPITTLSSESLLVGSIWRVTTEAR